jgi:poly(hydroxyalkanoate) depolymerase family esterase
VRGFSLVAVPIFSKRAAPGRWVAGPALRGLLCAVYLPAGHRAGRRAPLLMLLHGCDQDAEGFADASRFTTVADRHGLVLVAPEQTRRHHPNRCWRWYETRNQKRGEGEPAQLAEVVAVMLDERERWRIDPRRVYVAGISAGGAMALILAAVYPDLFAAVGVHSAPPYRAATGPASALTAMAARSAVPGPTDGAEPIPPIVVVQGKADRVVHPDNAARVAAQWLAFNGGGPLRSTTTTGSTTTTNKAGDGRGFQTTRWFGDRGSPVAEMWLIDDLGHAWSGGRAGGSYSDPAGPDAATLLWLFLRRHRLARRRARPLPVAGT